MDEGLVHVSGLSLAIAAVPLVALAGLSSQLNLELESPIVVGTIRTFVQLYILGWILQPIFLYGAEYFEVVILYLLFMVSLAAYEASKRSKYYFARMLPTLLTAFMVNIAIISIFTFGVVIRPTPVWDPQYVIPIVGMLLGNCISSVSLVMDSLLTTLVENSYEVELFLAFGGTVRESTSRLVRDAVRIGATPLFNTMMVIGLISIPGMMTGQILGGSPAMEAARYQILIIYLIVVCAFGMILAETGIAQTVGFDSYGVLRPERFLKRDRKATFLSSVVQSWRSLLRVMRISSPVYESEADALMTNGKAQYESTSDAEKTLRIETVVDSINDDVVLHAHNISCTIHDTSTQVKKVLCSPMSLTLRRGEIKVVRGPSGAGKSVLFRLLGLLAPLDDEGDLLVGGESFRKLPPTGYRIRVRYVHQSVPDIPGTPRQFAKLISSSCAWESAGCVSFEELVSEASVLMKKWGLDTSTSPMDRDWKYLSGGEAQRVLLALCMASRPEVLLMDESTSALDLNSKLQVETSVLELARSGVSVMWISHDPDQIDRLAANQ